MNLKLNHILPIRIAFSDLKTSEVFDAGLVFKNSAWNTFLSLTNQEKISLDEK